LEELSPRSEKIFRSFNSDQNNDQPKYLYISLKKNFTKKEDARVDWNAVNRVGKTQ